MKWSVLGERLFIFAAAVVLYWVAPQLQSWNLPSWVVTPLVGVVAVVAYQFLAAWGWFRPVRLLFDKRAKLIGQYVSKHTSGTTIAVFTIRLGFFDRKYRLNGDTYTTTPPILKDGNWWSDSLQIDGTHLKYIYKGTKGGLAVVDFNAHVTDGQGHFIEDVVPPIRTDSHYAKLARHAIRGALKRRWYHLPKARLGTEEQQRRFVEGYLALSLAEQHKLLPIP